MVSGLCLDCGKVMSFALVYQRVKSVSTPEVVGLVAACYLRFHFSGLPHHYCVLTVLICVLSNILITLVLGRLGRLGRTYIATYTFLSL